MGNDAKIIIKQANIQECNSRLRNDKSRASTELQKEKEEMQAYLGRVKVDEQQRREQKQ